MMSFRALLRVGYVPFLFLACVLALPLTAMNKLRKAPASVAVQEASLAKESLAIGVRTLTYQDSLRERPIVVELWYPSDAEMPLDQTIDSVWIHPKEMRDVPCAQIVEKFPLIMMSHGYGGERRDRSWLADHLVRHGFIVASLDHYGNTASTFNIISTLKFWDRGRDVSFAIDRLLEEPFLKSRVDARRIGFIGYSLGGMTGLGLAGAQAEAIEQVLNEMMKKYSEIQPDMLTQFDFKEAGKSLKDERIQAMMLICPASFIYSPKSLKKISIPIGLVVAPHDEVLPFKEHAELIIEHVVPAKLKIMQKETSHYAFLNRVSEEGKKFLKKHFYRDSPGYDRQVIHQEVGLFAVDFFKESLPNP
jgi:predicted dienelactone hydrolase